MKSPLFALTWLLALALSAQADTYTAAMQPAGTPFLISSERSLAREDGTRMISLENDSIRIGWGFNIYNGDAPPTPPSGMLHVAAVSDRLVIKLSDGQLFHVPTFRGTGTSEPTPAVDGDLYFRSDLIKLRIYAAGAWHDTN